MVKRQAFGLGKYEDKILHQKSSVYFGYKGKQIIQVLSSFGSCYLHRLREHPVKFILINPSESLFVPHKNQP